MFLDEMLIQTFLKAVFDWFMAQPLGSPTLFLIISPWLLWLFYLAIMAAWGAHRSGKLTKPARILGAPILLIGAILDVFCNIFIMTPLLAELPQEMLVTQRLKRHVKQPTWRGDIARWFGKHLLDPFDPTGAHLD